MAKFSLKQITTLAILSVISFLLMFFSFPIIPGASFLEIELSIIPIALAWSLYGYQSGLVVLLIRSLLKLIFSNYGLSTLIGLPINITTVIGFLILLFSAAKMNRWLKFALATLVGACIGVLVNVVYAIPVYWIAMNFDIARTFGIKTYLWGIVLPFSLIQGIVWSLGILVIFQSLKPFFDKLK